MTLVEFHKARLDEDEAAAKAWLPLGNPDAAARAHVARYDPGRVLAEVEAKRRIIERHHVRDNALACAECGGFIATQSPVRGIVHDGYLTPWPCPTLRLLALPYADHPDYDEAWRPQA